MRSSAFDGIMLSELEAGVGQYHNRLKSMFPVMSQSDEPSSEVMADYRQELSYQTTN